VARAAPREDVHEGPFLERAPDVLFELALEDGYAHSIVPTRWDDADAPAVRTLAGDELAGGRGRGMNGTHRPDGVWLAVGGERDDRTPPAGIAGVARRLLGALGANAPGADGGAGRYDYDAAEEARVAARLRALGYLE
jgi:hypothetical protein